MCAAVAALTAKIKAMAEHMRVHRKDYHSRRGLQAMLNQRRSLLEYLRRTDFDTYAIVLSRLGLKDNYMQLVRTQSHSHTVTLKGNPLHACCTSASNLIACTEVVVFKHSVHSGEFPAKTANYVASASCG